MRQVLDDVLYFPVNIVFVILADNVWLRVFASSVLVICYYMRGHQPKSKSSGGYAAAHGMGDD